MVNATANVRLDDWNAPQSCPMNQQKDDEIYSVLKGYQIPNTNLKYQNIQIYVTINTKHVCTMILTVVDN